MPEGQRKFKDGEQVVIRETGQLGWVVGAEEDGARMMYSVRVLVSSPQGRKPFRTQRFTEEELK